MDYFEAIPADSAIGKADVRDAGDILYNDFFDLPESARKARTVEKDGGGDDDDGMDSEEESIGRTDAEGDGGSASDEEEGMELEGGGEGVAMAESEDASGVGAKVDENGEGLSKHEKKQLMVG